MIHWEKPPGEEISVIWLYHSKIRARRSEDIPFLVAIIILVILGISSLSGTTSVGTVILRDNKSTFFGGISEI